MMSKEVLGDSCWQLERMIRMYVSLLLDEMLLSRNGN